MDFWKVLGLEPTTDAEAIRGAYREELKKHHPEEDPEGFKRLRAALEEALKSLEKDGDGEPDEFTKKIAEVYENFFRRINPDSWDVILEDEMSVSLDTSEMASETLLGYLMEHYYLPQAVWVKLEEFFGWELRKQELYSNFPPNFIDYVIGRKTCEDSIRYDMFQDTGEECDYEGFIKNYFTYQNTMFDFENAERQSAISEIIASGIKHPDFIIMRLRESMYKRTDIPLAEELLAELTVLAPEDTGTLYAAAQLNLANENPVTARIFAERLTEKGEKSGITIAADCDFMEKKFETAYRGYKEAEKSRQYDAYIYNCLYKTCEELVAEREAAEKTGTELEDYAEWANGCHKFQIAADNLEPVVTKSCRAHKLLGEAYEGIKEFEKAYEQFMLALEICEGDETEKAELFASAGYQRMELKEYDSAIEVYERGLEIKPGYFRLLYRKAATLNQLKRYEEAIECCDESLKDGPVPNSYHFKAEALYELNRFEESLENCDNALRIVSYYVTFVMKLKIFRDTGRLDDVIGLCDYLEQIDYRTVETDIFKIGALVSLKKPEEAGKLIDEVLDKEPENKDALYQLALAQWQEGEYSRALENLKLGDKGEENKVNYYYFMANINIELKEYKTALDILEKVLAERENTDEPYVLCRLGHCAVRMEKPNEAEGYFKRALELQPEHEYANSELADVYETLKEYDKAIIYTTRQLEINPTEYSYLQHGVFSTTLGKDDDALDAYEKALEINPNSNYAYNNKAHIAMKRGQLEEAIDFYEKAYSFGYPHSGAYYDLGQCYIRLKRYSEAVDCFKRAEAAFPDVKGFAARQGMAYYEGREYKLAIEQFMRYGKMLESMSWSYVRIANCYREDGNLRLAEEFHKQAISSDKKSTYAVEMIAKFYLEYKKNYKKAFKWYEKAFNMDAESGYAAYGAGESLLKLNRPDKAKFWFELALKVYQKEFDNETPKACHYDNLGSTYFKLGQLEKALEYLTKAVELGPYCTTCNGFGCDTAYYDLGEYYEQAGNREKAMECYKKAVEMHSEQRYRDKL